jgi:hypothetical protein
LRNFCRVSTLGLVAHQGIQQAFLGGQLGARLHILAAALAYHGNADFQQVAHDLLDIAADITDLGELGRFHLDEGSAGQPRQAARNLGFAAAGRPDHQNVLGQNFLAQFLGQLQAAPAIAQGDGDRALGRVLADDEAVEFGNDLAGGESGNGHLISSIVTFVFV